MGEIRKKDDTYYIEFYARGLMYSQVAGATEEGARRMLEAIESKIKDGEALTIVREIELRIFFDKFLEYAQTKFSPKSIQRFIRMWKHWIKFLSNNFPAIDRLSQITPSVIESYRSFLVNEEKPKVVNLTILLLREILEYGIKIGFINDNPTLHIRLLKTSSIQHQSGRRLEVAKDLLNRNFSLEKIYSILKLKDVAQIMYWSNFIPLKREDVY